MFVIINWSAILAKDAAQHNSYNVSKKKLCHEVIYNLAAHMLLESKII